VRSNVGSWSLHTKNVFGGGSCNWLLDFRRLSWPLLGLDVLSKIVKRYRVIDIRTRDWKIISNEADGLLPHIP